MQRASRFAIGALLLILVLLVYACATNLPRGGELNSAALAQQAPERSFEHKIETNAHQFEKT